MNPYRAQPNHAFWSRAVAGLVPADIDPMVAPVFKLTRGDHIATAGSCFAQHISRTLVAQGHNYLVTESFEGDGEDENYGVFPARSGNIYTVRQLRQTFDRAYGLFRPKEPSWRRPDGAWIDPFRPQIAKAGFPSEDALLDDRRRHLAAVRRMFERCDVLIFTLGLTEAWISQEDGAVFPSAPGVAGGEFAERHAFTNFRIEQMLEDFRVFETRLRVVNPDVRIILTVSPVPLIATFEPQHVLVANTYSKAALRVVADDLARDRDDVLYFPSYEIITGPQAPADYFAPDRRTVTDAGVRQVMSVFARSLLSADEAPRMRPRPAERAISAEDIRHYAEVANVVCDEEAIERNLR